MFSFGMIQREESGQPKKNTIGSSVQCIHRSCSDKFMSVRYTFILFLSFPHNCLMFIYTSSSIICPCHISGRKCYLSRRPLQCSSRGLLHKSSSKGNNRNQLFNIQSMYSQNCNCNLKMVVSA